jgi:hypothetical protein
MRTRVIGDHCRNRLLEFGTEIFDERDGSPDWRPAPTIASPKSTSRAAPTDARRSVRALPSTFGRADLRARDGSPIHRAIPCSYRCVPARCVRTQVPKPLVPNPAPHRRSAHRRSARDPKTTITHECRRSRCSGPRHAIGAYAIGAQHQRRRFAMLDLIGCRYTIPAYRGKMTTRGWEPARRFTDEAVRHHPIATLRKTDPYGIERFRRI